MDIDTGQGVASGVRAGREQLDTVLAVGGGSQTNRGTARGAHVRHQRPGRRGGVGLGRDRPARRVGVAGERALDGCRRSSPNETFTLIFLPCVGGGQQRRFRSSRPKCRSRSTPSTRIHCTVVVAAEKKALGTPFVSPSKLAPSTSAMVPTVAVSVWPTCAVPSIPGLPVAGSFIGLTSMVILVGVVAVDRAVVHLEGRNAPSYCTNPFRFAGGDVFQVAEFGRGHRLRQVPRRRSPYPESVSVPLPDAGSVTILTLARLSSVSASVKGK